MALAYPVSPNPLSGGDLGIGGHQRGEQVRRRHTDPGETSCCADKLLMLLLLLLMMLLLLIFQLVMRLSQSVVGVVIIGSC